ncbi:MAG: hypothetical protein KC609_06175 [Myxococcales bacterium]|nr:hypothetical protein [Myxococcales bacterium]
MGAGAPGGDRPGITLAALIAEKRALDTPKDRLALAEIEALFALDEPDSE